MLLEVKNVPSTKKRGELNPFQKNVMDRLRINGTFAILYADESEVIAQTEISIVVKHGYTLLRVGTKNGRVYAMFNRGK